MKHKILSVILIIVALVLISLQVVPNLLRSSQAEADENTLIASHIYDSLKSAVEKPIIISKAMSADAFLHKALKNEQATGEKEIETDMSAYLSAIKEKFGYIATFVVSEKTHRYYTPKGIAKIVNPKEEPYDIWYQLFLDSGKETDLDTDRDQVNDYRWTVFVNVRITDDDGSLMGVCGVGLFMDDLQDLVTLSEREYGVKINLIERDGLVQVDTDSANIENAYISEAIADKARSDSFVYTSKGISGFRLTRYLEDLEWFLVVQDGASRQGSFMYKASVLLLYLILIALLILALITKYNALLQSLSKPSLTEDSLTRLPNRNYLKESYGELGVFNTLRYKTLVMFDVDHFKTVDETRDGDKILCGVAEWAKTFLDEKGMVFRWSDDEFVIFCELDSDSAVATFEKFCAKVKETLDVTISVRIAEIDLGKSIKTNYHRAVQACYIVKESGGNGVRVCK